MRRTGLISSLPTLLLGAAATAEPMALSDPEPRWVQVRYEVSPWERPGQTDSVYSPPLVSNRFCSLRRCAAFATAPHNWCAMLFDRLSDRIFFWHHNRPA